MSDRRYDWHEVTRFDPYEVGLEIATNEATLLHAIAEQMNYNPFLRLSEYDQCECILRRVFAALDHFISNPRDIEAAVALVRDGKQHNCRVCVEREQKKREAEAATVATTVATMQALERGMERGMERND